MKNYADFFNSLKNQFVLGKEHVLENVNLAIRFFKFQSTKYPSQLIALHDNVIAENFLFEYPVIMPVNQTKFDSVIVLLHGLNERSWDKYLTWATTLCNNTGKPVLLFPIAFHMNRSPISWSNPRQMQTLINVRYMRNGKDKTLTYINAALSERISENPYRFYTSGRQSADDVLELINQIKEGVHPLFKANTSIDFFSYSIGSFLSQVLFLSAADNLLVQSKLFMFCGGSIFSSMFGESRCIMDRDAFAKLHSYYVDGFESKNTIDLKDNVFQAFRTMIRTDIDESNRIEAFGKMKNRLSGISLEKDVVIPYKGIENALGAKNARERINLLDFDYAYTHENPFPITNVNQELVAQSFNKVFDKASNFLAN